MTAGRLRAILLAALILAYSLLEHYTNVAAAPAGLGAAVAPRNAWSLFSNFLVLPLAALMFAAEYAVRRLRLPSMPRVNVAQTMRVYLADTRGPRWL